MIQHLWTLQFLLITLVAGDAKPTCNFYGKLQQDVICTPGDSDYVLRRGLVSDNNSTTGITLRGCRISDIDYESFENLFSLKYLDLSHNKIQELKLGVLDEDLQVTYLNLSYNLLTKFPLGLFDQKPNLEVMDLRGNMINTLELGIFDPLEKLRHLDLSSNALLGKDLNPYIFDRSTKIHFMDFSRNDMSGAPDNLLHAFMELDFLNLDRCFLKEVPQFATRSNLSTMKHLMLSTNQISTLDDPLTFVNLDNLEIINLAYNNIRHINELVFKPLRKLKVIVLRNNGLWNLPDTVFKSIPKLTNLDLSHNVLEYIPVNAFRETSLRNLNLADNRFSYLTNNFCLELRNSGVTLAKFNFNQNPWQCACLWELLQEVKIYNVDYNRSKYNGGEAVCVTSNDFHCKRIQELNAYYVEMYYNITKT